MKRVAVKGIAHDRSMYFFWDDEYSYEQVAQSGDKLSNRDTIKRLLNCDNETMALYRK